MSFGASGNYFPINTTEKSIYDSLWAASNPQNNELSGLSAVTFFQNSGVNIQLLKKVWSLVVLVL